jgi:hypothetical protein
MAASLVDVSVFERVWRERRKAEAEYRASVARRPSIAAEAFDWAVYFAFPCCLFGAGVGYVHGFTPGAMIGGAIMGCLGAVGLGTLYAHASRLS